MSSNSIIKIPLLPHEPCAQSHFSFTSSPTQRHKKPLLSPRTRVIHCFRSVTLRSYSFYTCFCQHAPIPQQIEIEEQLKPVGLYHQRAKRLKDLALQMAQRNGEFPADRKELESIPFLGQYIVNAIELQIFHKPSPLIDVNMSRVLERFFGERKMADIRYDPYLQDLSKRVVNVPKSKEINWAILDFAALICKARKPLCSICCVKNKCVYYARVEKMHKFA